MTGKGGKGNVPASFADLTELFYNVFPYYLSIGMTETQYWDGDSTLVVYYRKAEELRIARRNQELWLQGMYIYDAVGRLSPILHAFAKKGTKPESYVEEPYPITLKAQKERKRKKEIEISNKGLAKMESFMAKFNKNFEERG